MLKNTAASPSWSKGMANDTTRRGATALALAVSGPIPTPIWSALRLVAWWGDQPMFLMTQDDATKIAVAIESARQDLAQMFSPTDPREVVDFMAKFATRRGFALPSAEDLVADALAIATTLPADLFQRACQHLWTHFSYRRLPDPSDFTRAVKDHLDIRLDARSTINAMAVKLEARQRLYQRATTH